MTPTPEMIALAERVLARWPVTVGCNLIQIGNFNDPPVPCPKCGDTGRRPLTARELATPDGDRPNAHLDRLFWTQPESCLETRVDGIAAWISGRWVTKPTHHHAMLAALAAAGEPTP